MLDKQDIETIRGVVRLEIEAVVKQHLVGLTTGVLAPQSVAIADMQESLKLVVDGQQLVEKTLAARFPDDDEPWRQSLTTE